MHSMTSSIKSLFLSVYSTQPALIDNLKKINFLSLHLILKNQSWNCISQFTMKYHSGTMSEFQTYTFFIFI